jgi:hypothetical protein
MDTEHTYEEHNDAAAPSTLRSALVPDAPARRVRVFIDFWNFQLTMNDHVRRTKAASKPQIDFRRLGPWLADRAVALLPASSAATRCTGVDVYASHNPASEFDRGFRSFMRALSYIEGVRVVLKERRAKRPPSCPTCHHEVDRCVDPACRASMGGTIEKGIDTAIVADMMRLGWEGAFDVAILLSADADLIPGVEAVQRHGLAVLQASFPPLTTMLARACTGAVDLSPAIAELAR